MASITTEARCVSLPIGTKISISLANGKVLQMLAMGDDRAAALFSEDDVDFQIDVDNSRSDKGITFEVAINSDTYWYSLGPGEKGEPMKALVQNGRKLHFKSQTTDDGKMLVAATAAKYGMRYEDAALMCSKIKFHVKVEEQLERRTQPVSNIQQPYGYPNDPMFCFREYTEEEMSQDFVDSPVRSRSRSRPIPAGSYAAVDCRPAAAPTNHYPSTAGERGVICYGEKSNQKFGTTPQARIDEMYVIKPFVIELRMESKYSPV